MVEKTDPWTMDCDVVVDYKSKTIRFENKVKFWSFNYLGRGLSMAIGMGFLLSTIIYITYLVVPIKSPSPTFIEYGTIPGFIYTFVLIGGAIILSVLIYTVLTTSEIKVIRDIMFRLRFLKRQIKIENPRNTVEMSTIRRDPWFNLEYPASMQDNMVTASVREEKRGDRKVKVLRVTFEGEPKGTLIINEL